MNLDPNAIKVLCYGDSNTWGYIPLTEERYPVNVRWTGVLQELLGDAYWVVEEGLNGRTTDVDDPDSPGKDGLQYILPCLKTHNPIDLLVLMLGTNDLKRKFKRSPERIAAGIESLLMQIDETGYDKNNRMPQVILLSPIWVDDTIERAQEDFSGAAERSKQLVDYYRPIAEKNGMPFINVAEFAKPSKGDGIHLEPEDHLAIAEALHKLIIHL